MIYCVDKNNYPKEGKFLEEISYKDENDFEWRIARIDNGLMVIYLGDEYFSNDTFQCVVSSQEHISIKNTKCVFFKDASFETFCEIRDIIKNGYTDDIWESFETLFVERFKNNKDILESEKIN